jgi:hypothetical protein
VELDIDHGFSTFVEARKREGSVVRLSAQVSHFHLISLPLSFPHLLFFFLTSPRFIQMP